MGREIENPHFAAAAQTVAGVTATRREAGGWECQLQLGSVAEAGSEHAPCQLFFQSWGVEVGCEGREVRIGGKRGAGTHTLACIHTPRTHIHKHLRDLRVMA